MWDRHGENAHKETIVANWSNLPVTEIYAYLLTNRDGVKPLALPDLPPCSQLNLDMERLTRDHDPHNEGGVFVDTIVVFSFEDSGGRRWARTWSGALTARPDREVVKDEADEDIGPTYPEYRWVGPEPRIEPAKPCGSGA